MTDAVVDQTHDEPTRRDFIYIATGAFGAIGAGSLAWPFIAQMLPAADTLALSSLEVDLSGVPEGGEIRVLIGGKPFFVRHRTAQEIEAAQTVDVARLRDPETDEERLLPGPDGALKPQYLITSASCTHLGCVPSGPGTDTGQYGGWFCPCHGSHYDTSGRIRLGPAPANLPVPSYEYLSDTVVRISL
ncbi:MAG: ubiquinol-cytochrome c reductase iron-sulfur subunit [Caulobacterales bacterium]|nr:ubiquinol-cytochrome c reductase iron-sulfur subunit [Caulobacterales bacterium]